MQGKSKFVRCCLPIEKSPNGVFLYNLKLNYVLNKFCPVCGDNFLTTDYYLVVMKNFYRHYAGTLMFGVLYPNYIYMYIYRSLLLIVDIF